MKKITALLSSFILLLNFAVPVSAKKEYKKVSVDVPPKIVFLGDSIATGYGLEGYDTGKENCNSYANQLAKEYKAQLDGKCETNSENFAIDGQTSEELLKALQSGKYDESLKNADAVVVSIGGNDLLSVFWQIFSQNSDLNSQSNQNDNIFADNFDWSKLIASVLDMTSNIDKKITAFNSNISEIAKNIKNKTDANLVVQTLYNPFEDFVEVKQIQDFIADKIKSLNDCIESHKNDDGANYSIADVCSEFYGRNNELTRIQSMDIHPNQEGHNVIFKCIDKTIRLEKYTYMQEIETTPAQSESISENKASIFIWIAAAILLQIIIIFTVRKINSNKRKDKSNK